MYRHCYRNALTEVFGWMWLARARDRLAALVLVTLAKTNLLTPRESFRAKARSAHRADQDRNYRAKIAPPSGSSRSMRISVDRAEALPHRDLKAFVQSAKRYDSKARRASAATKTI